MRLLSATSPTGHDRVRALFDAGGPLLVEVRHPGGVVSSHWFLCDSEEDFDGLLLRLGADTVLHVCRVWDIHAPLGSVVLRR